MKLRLLVAFAAAAVLSACATAPEITTDYDHDTDFSQFRTYGFLPEAARGEHEGYSTLTERRIQAAVARELEARGYVRADKPDLLVNFSVTSKDIQEVREVPAASPPVGFYGWRYPYYHPWPAYSYETRVDNYRRGTLFIDLVDAKKQELVWEGIATARITDKMRKEPEAAIDSAVAEIFARYPFRAGGG